MKYVGVGLLGFGAGMISSVFYIKRKTEDYINQEVEQVREYYEDYLAELRAEKDPVSAVEQFLSEQTPPITSMSDADVAIQEGPSWIQKAAEERDEILKEMHYTDYSTQAPVEKKNVFEEAEKAAWKNLLSSQDRDSTTYLISVEEFMEDDNYDKITLTYFEEDDTLIEEKGETMVNIADTVGDANLVHFRKNPDSKDSLHVRNTQLGVDFEITLDERSYVRDFLGFPQDENDKPRPKKFKGDD